MRSLNKYPTVRARTNL